jgi:hypothetical protein
MSAVLCPTCGSDKLYQFEASSKLSGAPKADQLPQVCRSCSAIIIKGEVVGLPPEFGDAAVTMADLAEREAAAGREQMEQLDNGARIERWLQNFFKAAYMDGFFRALAYWNHHGKEGRLVRMRELWDEGLASWSGGEEPEESHSLGRMLNKAAYNEFEQLLHLSPGAKNAKSPENKSPTISKSPPRV